MVLACAAVLGQRHLQGEDAAKPSLDRPLLRSVVPPLFSSSSPSLLHAVGEQTFGRPPVTDLPWNQQEQFDRAGSTNVPMDSWIYPALERLAALGLVPSQSISIRPWTRRECLRQLQEAEENAGRVGGLNDSGNAEAEKLIDDLHKELAPEETASNTATLESAYVRYGTIAGPALADSYHFGQTWWNDFGRPLGRGSSSIEGFSARVNSGRFFFYTREEAQHGPGNPAQTPEINALINQLDTQGGQNAPFIEPISAHAAYQQYRPLELYAGVTFWGNALSFGKQELYWGPMVSGPLSFSSNAEPTWNLRFVTTRPHPIPFFGWLGTYRFDLVAGKLSGHKYPARPIFDGGKLDVNIGRNIEFSITRWAVLCGVGHPCSLHAIWRNLVSTRSTGINGGGGSGGYGDPTDPGDRKSGFDFRVRPPGRLGRVMTIYADSYADDELMPLMDPNRSAYSTGVYLARLPGLPQMDLRVESNSTTPYAGNALGGYLTYWNNQYLDANTNKGFLLGNAVGRDGRSLEAHLGYWFSGRSRSEVVFRQTKGDNHFLPGGSTITDAYYKGSFALNREWTAEVFAQYERFLIPSYMPGAQHNGSGWFQITWTPQWRLQRGK